MPTRRARIAHGLRKSGRSYRYGHRQQPRLFCSEEINFESDVVVNADSNAPIQAPGAFFVDPRLARGTVALARSGYDDALRLAGARFVGTMRQDGHHAFLAPVKASADQLAVDALVAAGVIDSEFVADVLAVDMGNPALSDARCRLLRAIPEGAPADWRSRFEASLTAQSTPAAAALLRNLLDPARDQATHQRAAAALLAACARKAREPQHAQTLTRLLFQRRAEIAASEISKNPRGQILEPGFRVIFPKLQTPVAPGTFTLNAECSL